MVLLWWNCMDVGYVLTNAILVIYGSWVKIDTHGAILYAVFVTTELNACSKLMEFGELK